MYFALFSFQFSSVSHSCLTPCDPMHCSMPGLPVQSITNSQSLLKLMSVESVMPSNHLILCRPLLTPSIFPSISIFPNESVLHIRWPKYWNFTSASVLPINIQDWFPLGWTGLMSLQSKGLSRVFSQKHSKVQKHWSSVFFIVQLSHPYTTTGNCFFNMLSRLVIAFLPRSKRLLISWLQSPSAVILEP